MQRNVVRHLIALGCALALAVVLTWPLVTDLGGSMSGHPGNDTWNHAWGFWWVQQGLLSGQGVPLSTELLNHPNGGTLFFIDTFSAVVSAPVAVLFGVPVALNFVVLFAFTWNAYGGWALGRHVLGDDRIAAIPAVIFAANAHVIGQAYNGITETLNAGWIPLYILALLRCLERPRWGRAAVMGLALAVCSLSNFYYGLFAILLSVIIALHRAITAWQHTDWKRFVMVTIGGAALYSALVLPVLGALGRSMDAPDAMVSRDPEFVWRSLINHNITDVLGLFLPGERYFPDLKALHGEDLLIVTYLGWTAMALSLLAFRQARPRRNLSLWKWLAVIFVVFALGPYLHFNGEYLNIEGRRLPLPFLAFFELFPLFSRISHPFRFVVPASLALGMLAGLGVNAMIGRYRLPAVPVIAGVCALVLVEILMLSPAPWPLPRSEAAIPSVYAEVLDADGAVLDLPVTVPNLERAVYTWYQTAHGRPSPYGLNDPIPQVLQDNPFTRFLYEVEASRAITLPHLLPELELVLGARMLRAQGVRWIVVHESLYPAHKREMVGRVLGAVLGEPRREGDVAVYEVPS